MCQSEGKDGMRKKWKESIKSLLLNKECIKEIAFFIGISSPFLFVLWEVLVKGSFWMFLLCFPGIMWICLITYLNTVSRENTIVKKIKKTKKKVENLMKKRWDWKEKIKSLIQNNEFLKENGFFWVLTSPVLFGAWVIILQGSFLEAFILTIPSIALTGFLLHVGTILSRDKTTNEKKKKKETHQNSSEQKEKDYLRTLYKEAVYSSCDVSYEMRNLANTIEKIQIDCNITQEEKTYLTVTLPKQLLHMLELYDRIEYQYRDELEKEILVFLAEKNEECIKNYIEPYQHQLVSECKQVLQEARQQKHEYIHITIEE